MPELHVEVIGAKPLAAAFGAAPALVDKEARIAMEASLVGLRAEIDRVTPVDTGRLRAGTAARMTGVLATGLRGIVVNRVPYAVPVEFGTRPHLIRPRRGRVLRFEVNGRTVFAREVRHPGTRGAHMFRDGLKAATPHIRALFARVTARVAAAIAAGGAR